MDVISTTYLRDPKPRDVYCRVSANVFLSRVGVFSPVSGDALAVLKSRLDVAEDFETC